MKYSAPKGTRDILIKESALWVDTEKKIRTLLGRFGYGEIRTPEFEDTGLFTRGVGEDTDIVTKEMYTFTRNNKDFFTLKPEGTSPVARAYIQHGMSSTSQPVKLFYITSCYRAENPQKGRQRQFHQFGVEVIGSASPLADAEVIRIADMFLRQMGVENMSLRINSVGCPTCRQQYYEILREYLKDKQECLCDDCKARLKNNPMRLLDCKNERCIEILANAPIMTEHLCKACEEHFDALKANLNACKVEYTIDAHIVRGLDYYTNTAFEFVCSDLGAQSTICGGGRYNGLIASLGGEDTPGVGFGLGLERLLLSLQEKGKVTDNEACDLYIASIGQNANNEAALLQSALIKKGYSVQSDIMGRSLKAQMKYADKLNARFVLILGEDEIASHSAIIRDMNTKSQCAVSFDKLSRITDILG